MINRKHRKEEKGTEGNKKREQKKKNKTDRSVIGSLPRKKVLKEKRCKSKRKEKVQREVSKDEEK